NPTINQHRVLLCIYLYSLHKGGIHSERGDRQLPSLNISLYPVFIAVELGLVFLPTFLVAIGYSRLGGLYVECSKHVKVPSRAVPTFPCARISGGGENYEGAVADCRLCAFV